VTRAWSCALLLGCALACAGSAEAQQPAPTGGRAAALALRFEPLEFRPPRAEEHTLASGVRVLYLEDRSLPLVNVYARFRGGFSNFPRAYYAAATALPALVRSGGTRALPPDSLEGLLERYAIATSVGTGGGSSFATLNTLTRNLDVGLELLGDMLRSPRFDSARVEVWRGQELESVRRRADDPGRLAFSEFNRLLFGDHPIGWEMEPSDLEPEDLARDRLEWLHRRVFCPGNLILGVTGDVSWEEIEPRLQRLLAGWAPCAEALPRPPRPEVRTEPGVFVIPRPLDQSTVVMAHVVDVRQGDTPDYFASRIGTSIVGSGGMSSRLMARLRTERGYAYSASALWTAPVDYQGLVGAVTQTKSDRTVAAVRLMLETLDEMTATSPSEDEVDRTVDEIVNGFVFNFESPAQIVSRQMAYRASRLPDDWLERYLAGIQEVDAEDVRRVFRQHVHPERMVILVVGDPEKMDEPLAALGPVTVLEIADPAAGEP
jgi:predicted Zn-dependent peptidase